MADDGKKTLTFKVTAKVWNSVSEAELREYMQDALDSWGGQRHPDDHLFSREDHSFKIVRFYNRKPKQPEEVGE